MNLDIKCFLIIKNFYKFWKGLSIKLRRFLVFATILMSLEIATLAQRQSNCFVNSRLGVRVLSSAQKIVASNKGQGTRNCDRLFKGAIFC